MSRRSSLVQTEDSQHTRTLSRSSSVASSHLSRWSKGPSVADTPSRRGSLADDGHASPRDPYNGHQGHLTPEQLSKLDEFKSELGKLQVYFEGGAREEGGGKGRGRVDDSTLLRFLRARKFDVSGAVKQYTAFLKWRDDKQIDDAYEDYEVDQFEELRRVYPMWTGRRDLRGVPIYVYKISALTPATLSKLIPNDAASTSSIAVVTLALIRFLLPFTSSIQAPDQKMPVISGTNSIVDVGNVGLSRFWGLRSHLQVASQVASANFPETIDRVFVVGAPSFFPTVFNWAKKWFDPGTVEKIHILSDNTLPTLLEMMPKESIPKEYGGELDWTYGQDPNLDDEARHALGGEWVRGPVSWDSRQSRVKPVGRVGKERRDAGYDDGASSDGASLASSPVDGRSVSRGRTGQAPAAVATNGHADSHDSPSSPVLPTGSGIPSTDSPASSIHSRRSSSSSTYHYKSSRRSADAHPIPSPTSRVIPGTHIPVHHSSLTPKGAYPERGQSGHEHGNGSDFSKVEHVGIGGAPVTHSPASSMSGRSGKSSVETRNEAIEIGWVPGSGVTEEEFLSMVSSTKSMSVHSQPAQADIRS